jgi:hypothetical protein
MKRSLAVFAAAVLAVVVSTDRAVAQGRRSNVVMPPEDQRRSMGNLWPRTPVATPQPTAPAATHRKADPPTRYHHRWAYGRAPYDTRPPVTPYSVYPQPYGYVQPYYVYPTPYGVWPYYYGY